jgi:hypothetical protein
MVHCSLQSFRLFPLPSFFLGVSLSSSESLSADKHASYLILFWPAALAFSLLLLIASVGVCEMAGLTFPSKYALSHLFHHVLLHPPLTPLLQACRSQVLSSCGVGSLSAWILHPGMLRFSSNSCDAHHSAARSDVSRIRSGRNGVRRFRGCRSAAVAARFALPSIPVQDANPAPSAANFLRGVMQLVVDNRDAGIFSRISEVEYLLGMYCRPGPIDARLSPAGMCSASLVAAPARACDSCVRRSDCHRRGRCCGMLSRNSTAGPCDLRSF